MNILIIGTIGSGKSSIGAVLAKILHMRLIELDDMVLHHTGFKSIEAVYQNRISLWKECELEISRDMSTQDNNIIVCGGGFVENELNITYFKEHSDSLRIIYIHARPEMIAKRLHAVHKELSSREITEKVNQLYARRDTLCRMYADTVIENENREVFEAAEEIVSFLHHKTSKKV